MCYKRTGRPHSTGRLQILLLPRGLFPWLQNSRILLPCTWSSTTFSSSFSQCLLSCPVTLVCLCAQKHDLSWLFWNACCLPVGKPVEPSRALCISSPSLFHFSVFMSAANSVCNGDTFFSDQWSNYKMGQAAVELHLTGKYWHGSAFVTY